MSACATTAAPSSTSVEGRGQLLSTLQGELAEVAELQAGADTSVNEVLGVVHQVDDALEGLSATSTLDPTLEAYEQVHTAVTSTQVEGLRDGYLAVADAVDDARGTLAAAREELAGDPWEVEYLDAQDQVLTSVRDYAEAADKVAQLLERHWPTYQQADQLVAEIAAGREAGESVDALVEELDALLADLAVAQSQIAEYGQARATSGQAVNDATAELRDVHDRRPGASTP